MFSRVVTGSGRLFYSAIVSRKLCSNLDVARVFLRRGLVGLAYTGASIENLGSQRPN